MALAHECYCLGGGSGPRDRLGDETLAWIARISKAVLVECVDAGEFG